MNVSKHLKGGGITARQAPLSTELPSTQEYWRRWPLPSLGDLPHPGIELPSPAVHASAGGFLTRATWEAQYMAHGTSHSSCVWTILSNFYPLPPACASVLTSTPVLGCPSGINRRVHVTSTACEQYSGQPLDSGRSNLATSQGAGT